MLWCVLLSSCVLLAVGHGVAAVLLCVCVLLCAAAVLVAPYVFCIHFWRRIFVFCIFYLIEYSDNRSASVVVVVSHIQRIGCQPEQKLLYTVANPARGLLNREKKKKKKSGSAPPLPPRALLVRRKDKNNKIKN